jgi:hypothetical protein
MLLKRSYILLAVGISLIVAGTVVLSFISMEVHEKFSSIVIIIPDETLPVQTSYSASFDLFAAQNSTLAIASRVPNSFLSVRLADEDGKTVVESAFNDKMLIPLNEFGAGSYQITVTNFDKRPISVNAIIAPETMLTQLEDFLSLAYNTLAASTVVFSGVVICIVGAIFWIIDKRKQKKVDGNT